VRAMRGVTATRESVHINGQTHVTFKFLLCPPQSVLDSSVYSYFHVGARF
jgi:hypothetical protein